MGKRIIAFVVLIGALWMLSLSLWAQGTPSTGAPVALVQLITNIRTDLETLADLAFAGGTRPSTWTGNGDTSSPSIIADIWYDNEQLADAVFGASIRPDNWIGATSSNAFLVVRNVRHDLELAANELVGEDIRPQNWAGAPRIFRCSRTVQNTLFVLQNSFNVTPTTLESAFDYCAALEGELENELVTRTFNVEETDPNAVTRDFPSLILAVRGDLERLADERLGLNTRPEGWRGNKDVNSINLTADNFADLELLADTLIGLDQRPEGWIGSITASAAISYRNLRFDIELLADTALGAGVRPRGWQGIDPVSACSPSVQNLVTLLQRLQSYVPTIPPDSSTDEVCRAVEDQVNGLVENPPRPEVEEVAEGSRFDAESRIAFAYLDVAATQFMGEMPQGIEFRAWYRNFGDSNMMFVSGENFAVFIDRRWTTLPDATFAGLPTLEGVRPLTFCDAGWCNGPRATPTYTGDALFDIINAATPPATVDPSASTDSTGKQRVSWNHIRVGYILQNSSTGRAQVTLEICRETDQINCEPVTSVLNTITGVPVPVVSVINNLNVYEMPYGYTANWVIEGATLFSPDVWLNDPSLGGP
jgi:hypothetical protein